MSGSRWLRLAPVLLIVGLGLFSLLRLNIDDNALDLLPGEAVQGDLRLLQRLGLVDRVFLTLTVEDDTLSADQRLALLQQSASQVGKAFTASNAFSEVIFRLPHGYEFSAYRALQPTVPALLDEDDLLALAQLTTDSGMAERLAADFSLLNSLAGIAVKRQIQQDPLGITTLALAKLKHLKAEYAMLVLDGFFISEDKKSCLLMAESRTPLTDAASAKEVEKVVLDALALLDAKVAGRVIGSLPHTLANARSIQHDLQLLLPIASLLLLFLLVGSLRDGRALLVLGIPFLAAPFAIGLVNMVFGRISALALGFGIVLLGIAVDFSVHIYLALRQGQGSRGEILARLRKPLLLATLTTSAVFIVLFFSQVASHRQMALLALVGVVLAVGMAWLLIPLLRPRPRAVGAAWNYHFLRLAGQGRFLVIFLWLLLLVLGGLSWPQLHYNGDLRVLDAPDDAVKADEVHFQQTWGEPGDQAFVLAHAPSLGEALERNSLVYGFIRQQQVSSFQSLAPLMPGPQAQQDNLVAWQQFWAQRPDFEQRFKRNAEAYGFNSQAFAPFFSWLRQPPVSFDIEALQAGPLHELVQTLIRPPVVKGEGIEADFLVVSSLAMEQRLYQPLLQLSEEQDGIELLTNEKWRKQVEQLLRQDIMTLSLAAGLVIVLIVGLALRRLPLVLGALAPVVSALAAMAIYSFISHGQLNMMHLLMGIMVIGLSVDYGIFMVCTGQEAAARQAITICACSSIIGFGVLAFATHPALHALGITVLVGIGAAWPTALLVTPVLAGER